VDESTSRRSSKAKREAVLMCLHIGLPLLDNIGRMIEGGVAVLEWDKRLKGG